MGEDGGCVAALHPEDAEAHRLRPLPGVDSEVPEVRESGGDAWVHRTRELTSGRLQPGFGLVSVGVIFCLLMTGDMPYSDEAMDFGHGSCGQPVTEVGSPGMRKIFKKLEGEKVDWECAPWPDFPLARDLCQKLMEFDPSKRINSAQEALKHQWLAKKAQSYTSKRN